MKSLEEWWLPGLRRIKRVLSINGHSISVCEDEKVPGWMVVMAKPQCENFMALN
jgi:hypothetical protein